MAHTYCSLLFHCIFSTKERRPTIETDLQERLWGYMGGIARKAGIRALAIGGSEDHAHLLLEVPASLAIAKAMQNIKRGSSLWMHETCGRPGFEWQEGYGAFSIGRSQLEVTVAYIARQREHHERRNFQAEFAAILTKYGIEYDPRHVWG